MMTTEFTTSVVAALKTWCARATRSPITMAFFLSMIANYATQTALHTSVLSFYARNRTLVTSFIDAAGIQRGFTVVRPGLLEICSGIPRVPGTACYTLYNASAASIPASVTTIQCAAGLTWLESYLINSKSEEALYLVLEGWLFVVSLIALMDESIPHLIVVLVAQFVNTGWISYRIAGDISAKRTYDGIVVAGTCGGFDILGGSWQYDMFYVTLGFSIAALLCMSFLVIKLITLYSKSKLSSVGAPPIMKGILRWRLWMRVSLQFAAFFVLASAAAWYDKRKSFTITSYYPTNVLYDVGFYVVAIITLPWLVLGQKSVSRENRLLFLAYAILSIILLTISGLWFGSALYRHEYLHWGTFSCTTTVGDCLLVITCTLSVICRLNFGNGLAHFLVVEKKLQASGFAYDTFLDDPSRSSVGTEKAIAKRLSYPALDQSQSSSKGLRHPSSLCSVESAAFATWLSYMASQDLEKSELQTGRPVSTIVITRDDMSWCPAQSVSDDGSSSLDEVDEKRMIVS